jgi:hypothetical protein
LFTLARNSRKSPQRFTLGSKPFIRPLVKHPLYSPGSAAKTRGEP